MTEALTYIGLMGIGITIVLTFIPWRWTVLAAYATLWLCYLGEPGAAYPALLIFWGVAALIVTGLNILLPRQVVSSRVGVGYFAGGALTGLVLGLLIAAQWMVIGSAVGAILGAMAYSRTPAGSELGFPSRRFFNYLCAKALPIVVSLSMAGYGFIIALQSITAANL